VGAVGLALSQGNFGAAITAIMVYVGAVAIEDGLSKAIPKE
jgi:hypothetical protein